MQADVTQSPALHKHGNVIGDFTSLHMNFKNRQRFTKQALQLKQSSLHIHRKNFFDEIEYDVSFEQIGNKKKIQVLTSNLFYIGIFIFVFGLCFVLASIPETAAVLVFLSSIFIVVAFFTKTKTITVATYQGEDIVLFFNNTNKQEVSEFADLIIESSNNFLFRKYGKIDKDLPIEPQLDNIEFLRNREVITEEQYVTLKNQLLGRSNKSSIGFGASA